MKITEKYDILVTGLISGALFPALVGLIVYAFTAHGKSIGTYIEHISHADIVIHEITLCVFPNALIFFLFNQFDMLRAAKGVLAVTIVYAIVVFLLRLL